MTLNTDKLQKVLAQLGVASRREAERLIESGRVQVNDEVAHLGMRVTGREDIKVNGRSIKRDQYAPKIVRRVLVYNKPEGEVCSTNDPDGRRTVFDRLPKIKGARWISVGRLDINTSGLLIFTTDGELANRLMHPSWNIDREYAVRLLGEVTPEMITNLLEGVMLEDGLAKFTDVQRYNDEEEGSKKAKSSANQWYHVCLMEGKNREVRRLWESQGLKVSRLKRVRYGNIFLDSVRAGTWREMEQKEVDALAKVVELPPVRLPKLSVKDKQEFERAKSKQRTRRSV